MQYLPFADDMREWAFASLPQPSPEQRSVVAALVDAMDLDKVGTHLSQSWKVGGESMQAPTEFLQPESTNSPSLGRFYAFLAQRAVDPKAKVQPPTHEQSKAIERPESMLNKLEAAKCGNS
jgi:hypothetical protein